MTISHRYDFVLLFDVKDGNPNGDPDAGNLPRVDAETGQGLVTDVALKRKIRNFVSMVKSDTPPFDIYVKEKAVLNLQHERAYIAIGEGDVLKGDDKKRKGSGDVAERARAWMCANFFDVRTFGAVMSLGVNCGQVRGPVQLTFARSISPIVSQEHSITRMAVATEEEAKKQAGDNRTMGRKHTVPYGLYVAHGFISSFLAKQTGFSDEDLALLWQALGQMFEHDRSAARGEMSTRGLYVFEHESELGNARAHELFARIQAQLTDPGSVPRAFSDYTVTVDEANLPAGVTLHKLA
ncbi:CRISPR-associated protein, TM1801 family [Oxalobacteraceae bacterium IMCC9480]|nr:CRISPR-associated protein, TM1801 family [Oxalobacteraceae bacterium IMCC9480]NDP59249.1 type I-C CRISPR-associated protein Cas7/Csd2 [Oxalobacteraceae bacterium]